MIKKTFNCNACKKHFDAPKFYEEKHGLDTPPYERIAVCPYCYSSDFSEFDTAVYKIDVAERVLNSIAFLNKFGDDIKDIFGSSFENSDFNEGLGLLTEYIDEMFDFITVQKSREILNLRSQNDIEKVLLYLKGEL